MKEAQDRLDRALYSIIIFGIVVEAYQSFMEDVEDNFPGLQCNLHTAVHGIRETVGSTGGRR